MGHRVRSELNEQVYEEACAWLVECRGGDLSPLVRREFDRWLRTSPEHLSAYLEVAAIWDEAPVLDKEQRWDSAALVAEAAAGSSNVIPLLAATRIAEPATTFDAPAARSEHASHANTAGAAGKQRQVFVIAASIALAVLGVWIWLQQLRVPTHATALGEQRFIELVDGSTVDLNSRSKIRVRYSRHQRSVELVEGQALFRVAKDAARPFSVTSDRARVLAVGTQFDVYRKRQGTIVSVVEGRVAIFPSEDAAGSADPSSAASRHPASSSPAEAGAAGLVLVAGEQATVTADVATKTPDPDVARATAWTEGQLIFESAPLVEVAEEFNRYNARQLVIEDDALKTMHISGVFSPTDPSSLGRFLQERGVAQVIETPTEIRIAKNE